MSQLHQMWRVKLCKNGKAGFQAHCCAGPTPPRAASSDSIFLLAGCRKPSTAWVVLGSYKDLPSPAVSPDIKSMFVLVSFGGWLEQQVLSSVFPPQQNGSGWGPTAPLQSSPKSLFWENLCSKLSCLPPAPRNNVFCYQPPPSLTAEFVYWHFQHQATQRVFPHINSKCHKEQKLVPKKPV